MVTSNTVKLSEIYKHTGTNQVIYCMVKGLDWAALHGWAMCSAALGLPVVELEEVVFILMYKKVTV